MGAALPNPRTHRNCYYVKGQEHDWQPWRAEGWLVIDRCTVCGHTQVRSVRPKGVKECLVCQALLTGKKLNWCGNQDCWERKAAYSSPTGWSQYIHYRDKEVCRDCGVVGTETEAHHIHPLEHGGIELDPDNGQLLCLQCHADRHGQKRRGVRR